MQQKNPQADAILKTIQEREQNHLLQLQLCTALAQATDRNSLAAVVQQLKSLINFNAFVIAVTDRYEKEYNIFFHDSDKSQAELLGAVHQVEDEYFNTAQQSAEPVIFNLLNVNPNKAGLPVFIQRERQVAMREAVAFPLHYHKENPSVLFLFFKNARGFTPQVHRLLKSISMQLALTVSNCLITQKIALYGNTPSTVSVSQAPETVIGEAEATDNFSGIIGRGAAMQKVITLIEQVAPSDSGVLLLGESGVGKEVIASAIHQNSERKNRKMVRINCAAIPANLIESELFGHEKGSFTGATDRRIGKFEQADKGTLFLDEIGELPLALQTKLLRVLQEREFERIGGSKTIKVNVRIIAATNLNLEAEVTAGRFRADLFYRLNVFPIIIPPLRDRKEDIAPLSEHFISEFCKKNRKKTKTLAAKVLEALTIYTWPGNVRELRHILERSILLTTGSTITEIYLPEIVTGTTNEDHNLKTLEEVEKEHILKAIKFCNGRISGANGAAKKLGIPHTTLLSKMQKLGIRKSHAIK
jgi:formate hydrogenlyase transcriptional activator